MTSPPPPTTEQLSTANTYVNSLYASTEGGQDILDAMAASPLFTTAQILRARAWIAIAAAAAAAG